MPGGKRVRLTPFQLVCLKRVNYARFENCPTLQRVGSSLGQLVGAEFWLVSVAQLCAVLLSSGQFWSALVSVSPFWSVLVPAVPCGPPVRFGTFLPMPKSVLASLFELFQSRLLPTSPT